MSVQSSLIASQVSNIRISKAKSSRRISKQGTKLFTPYFLLNHLLFLSYIALALHLHATLIVILRFIVHYNVVSYWKFIIRISLFNRQLFRSYCWFNHLPFRRPLRYPCLYILLWVNFTSNCYLQDSKN